VYVYDALGQLAAEYGGAGTDAGTHYLTVDALGSTRLETSGTAQTGPSVVRNYDYLPFGQEIGTGTAGRDATFSAGYYPSAATGQSDRFTGKERDAETGLDYFEARYFSAAQGRFTSPDWAETPEPVPYADVTDPQTLNLYAYVRNNPLSRADADGHCPWCIGALIGGVGGGAASIISQKWSHPERSINWKQVGAATLGGAAAGGTLGLATAPAALVTVLGGETVLETGTAVAIGTAAGAGVAGGITERAVASGGDPNAALGTPGQIVTDAAVGAVVQGVSSTVVAPILKQGTTAGRAVAVGEAKVAAGTKPSPSLPQRQAQLSTQQKVASGAVGAGVDAANRAKQQPQPKKKPEDEQR
jgi:RHS repeat-associated protein